MVHQAEEKVKQPADASRVPTRSDVGPIQDCEQKFQPRRALKVWLSVSGAAVLV